MRRTTFRLSDGYLWLTSRLLACAAGLCGGATLGSGGILGRTSLGGTGWMSGLETDNGEALPRRCTDIRRWGTVRSVPGVGAS